MMENVVLVNEKNEEIGFMEKMEAHRLGLLHRAFSVVLYNDQGEMLIQKRASTKYHTPGLWTNACCSHPREGETVIRAAHRRLEEELGMDCPLETGESFIYKASFPNGLTEHEYDTLVLGRYSGEVPFNLSEVEAVKWISMSELIADVALQPEIYTPWFREILKRIK
jgi:isopentenyl-diphosphate delta-isomerase